MGNRFRHSLSIKKRFLLLSTKKKLLILFLIPLGILVAILLFYQFIHPFTSRLYSPFSIYEGTHYYTEKKYLKFQEGPLLDEIVQTTSYANNGTPNYFYYCNTWGADNPLSGKMVDTYAIEFSLQKTDYLRTKERVVAECRFLENEGYFKVYKLNYDTGDDSDAILIALHDKEQLVRYVLLSDNCFDMSWPNSDNYVDMMRRWSTIDWYLPAYYQDERQTYALEALFAQYVDSDKLP